MQTRDKLTPSHREVDPTNFPPGVAPFPAHERASFTNQIYILDVMRFHSEFNFRSLSGADYLNWKSFCKHQRPTNFTTKIEFSSKKVKCKLHTIDFLQPSGRTTLGPVVCRSLAVYLRDRTFFAHENREPKEAYISITGLLRCWQ